MNNFTFLESLLLELLKQIWLLKLFMVMASIIFGQFLFDFYGYVTGSTGFSSREEQPEQLTPENGSDLLQESNMTHPLPQHTSSSTVCQAEKPDGPRPKKKLVRKLGLRRTSEATLAGLIPEKIPEFLKRADELLVKHGSPRECDANKTASVKVIMNRHQVDMVIDRGCLETIISQHQWQILGEPKLRPLRETGLVTSKRTGKYKEHVKREEVVGFFYAIVQLQDKKILHPIYVCAGDKTMPNFLGRGLIYDLHLHRENVHLIKITDTTEALPQTPTTEPVPGIAETTSSPVGQQSADSDAEHKTRLDLRHVLITYLVLWIETEKDKNKKNREKYEQRMSETIKNIMKECQTKKAERVDYVASEKKSEPEVIVLKKSNSIDKLRKTISKLENIYKKDSKRSRKVIREAEEDLSNQKTKLASASSESEHAELTESVKQREKALQVIVKKENIDFEEKMASLTGAKEMFLEPQGGKKGKKFFKGLKTMFKRRSSNNLMLDT